MTRQEILNQIRPYFEIKELVCDHTYARYGEAAWQFLDTDFLHCLLVIRRDILKRPMWCNHHSKGIYQKGLRCNLCQLVKEKKVAYISAHVLGKAGDFSVDGLTADQVRQIIIKNQGLLPYPIRMEDGVTWLHFDVRPNDYSTAKVSLFKG